MIRNLKRLFHGRRHQTPAPTPTSGRRVRLNNNLPDRPPLTTLTIGPAEMFNHGLPAHFVTNGCWLVQFEGPGYVDHYPCYSKGEIEFTVRFLRRERADVTITYLKRLS